MPAASAATPQACRLCGGTTQFQFTLTLLGRHEVGYFRCTHCQSLQTETPYWLDAAYGAGNLSNLDTGAAQRNLINAAACLAVARLFGLHQVIDIGGGDGLLCRLLRDHEVNCYAQDKHALPTYAQGFEEPDFEQPDLVLAFEVVEHFADPEAELRALFARRPKAVLISTAIYTDQRADWWYLAPESGQHVFFYSRQALGLVAATHGYTLVSSGGFLLFLRQGLYGRLRTRIARLLLKTQLRWLLQAHVLFLSTDGVWKDHRLQAERAKAQQQEARPSFPPRTGSAGPPADGPLGG